jgi:hypothetical protein
VRLKAPDKIDRKHGGFLNFVERLVGKGRMFHCRWCRLQFFDRRPLATDVRTVQTVQPAAALVPEVEKTAGPAQ